MHSDDEPRPVTDEDFARDVVERLRLALAMVEGTVGAERLAMQLRASLDLALRIMAGERARSLH